MQNIARNNIQQKLLEDLGSSITDITPIGAGGFGEVFKAFSTTLDRFVAIKVLTLQSSQSSVELTRFIVEAKVLSRLSHENIVRIFKFGQLSNGMPYFVMEFVEGESFARRIASAGPFSVEQAQPIFTEICDAVGELHANGILHRDISSSNCMILTGDGKSRAKLIDLGLVKGLSETLSGQKLTQTMQVCGSLPYLSPEALRGKAIDERSDVYSLTCLLYEMLTGVPPFRAPIAEEIMALHVSSEHVPIYLQKQEPIVYPDLEELITRGLAKNPADRFSSVQELSQAFNRVSKFIHIGAYKNAGHAGKPAHKLFSSNRVALSVVAAGLVATLCLCAGALILKGGRQSSKDLYLQAQPDRAPETRTSQERKDSVHAANEALQTAQKDQLLTETQEIELLNLLCRLYQYDNCFADCQRCYERAYQLYVQNHRSADYLLGGIIRAYHEAAVRNGHYREAIANLEKVIPTLLADKLMDERLLTQTDLIDLYIDNGEFAKALKLEQTIENEPHSGERLAVKKLKALCVATALHLGDKDAAIKYHKLMPPGNEDFWINARGAIRAEIADDDWHSAREMFTPRRAGQHSKYNTHWTDQGISGIQFLLWAHDGHWVLAQKQYLTWKAFARIAPWDYYRNFNDFDTKEYATMLRKRGLTDRAAQVENDAKALEAEFRKGKTPQD